MSIIIFGLGKNLRKKIVHINEQSIVAFCDSDISKRDKKELLGKPIISPEQLKEFDVDYIVISTNIFFDEIANMLIFKYCINIKKIVFIDYYLSLYGNRKMIKLYKENCRYLAKKTYINSKKINYKNYSIDYYNKENMDYLDAEKKLKIIWNDSQEDIEEIYNIKGILTKYYNPKTLAIYVVTHKNIQHIKINNYYTIHVGDTNYCKTEYLSDNNGNNISHLNSLINECTALYWIWKNDKNEYVGLNHYRRFLESPTNKGWAIQKWEIFKLLEKNDVIVAERGYFGEKTVVEQLREAVNEEAFQNSYECILEIFRGKEMVEQNALEKFLESNYFFPCQLFVMHKSFLEDYCSWLFPILFEMINIIYINPKWDDYSKRIIGFWAERLLTVWLLIKKPTMVELPIIMTD